MAYKYEQNEDSDDFLRMAKKAKRQNIKNNDYSCTHNDEERGFVGTFTHEELFKALAMGYRITHIIRSWHWEKWSNTLFRKYIKAFLKMKMEASWDETRPIEERDAVIAEYKKRYDIDLDPENMRLNEGMRFVAKLCLNSVKI